MADTVGEATFLVKIRDMVTGPMKGIAASISTTMRDISKIAAGNLLSTGITRAVDAMKNFVAQGIATNMQMDNLNVTFTTMLGSQRKANKLMAELVTFAAKTPFEMEGLAQNAAALLATGNVGEQQVIPMLKKLGDAAAGSTEGFAAMPRVVRAIAQMMSKGKLQAEEMNQLAEAGIPAWGALAKQMGMSTAEVMALASKGKLGMKEIGMLVDGLGNKYAGLADKQSKTFSGMLSTLKDNVSLAMAKITRPIYDRMTLVMQKIAAYMDSGAFTKGLDRIVVVVSYIMDLLFKAFDSPLAMAVVKFAAILASVIAVGAALSWVPVLAGMAYAVAPFVAALGAIVALAALIGNMFRQAFSGPEGDRFRKTLQEIWVLLKEIGINLRDGLAAGLRIVGGVLSSIFGTTGSIQQGFNGMLGAGLDWIKGMLENMAILTTNWELTWQFMKEAAVAAIYWIGDQIVYTLNERIPFALAALIEGMIAGGTEFIKHWRTLFESLLLFVEAIFKAWFDAQMARIKGMIEAAKLIAKGRPGDAVSHLVNSEVGAVVGQAKANMQAGSDFVANTKEPIGKVGAAIAGAMANVWKAMPEFKSSAAGQKANEARDKTWGKMESARGQKKTGIIVDDFKGMLKQVPDKIGEFIGEWTAKGGMGLFGGLEDALGMLKKKPEVPAEPKKERKKYASEFVGFADMNKRIQGMLVDTEKKKAADAAKKAAANAEKGAKAAVDNVKEAKATNKKLDSIGRLLEIKDGFSK